MSRIPYRHLKQHIERALLEPNTGKILAETVLYRLNDETFFSQPFLHFIGQKFTDWDIYDAYAANEVLNMWNDGKLAFYTLPVSSPPLGDTAVDANQSVLSKLPKMFEAKVTCERGRNASDDGFFRWLDPLEPFDTSKERLEVCPSTLPLEIGYTHPCRTLLHLIEDKGVVRWPYDCSALTIGRVIDRYFLTPPRPDTVT